MPASAVRAKGAARESTKAASAGKPGAVTVLNGEVRIPSWAMSDLGSFCRWACSEDFPQRGQYSFLRGEIWADLSMEEFYSHNQVKEVINRVLGGLVEGANSGRYLPDRMLLRHTAADLSTEPDGMFVSYDSLRNGQVRLLEGTSAPGYYQVEGTPEMVLEIVSATSEQKDTVELRDLYWQAGIPEYWLVDARGTSPRFQILHRGAKRYAATRAHAGWTASAVFARAFRLTRQPDPLGHPRYVLSVQP
jgi:Uma2 family endonuclease